jgi:simple sugar transport system substrate-binding protein
VAVLSIGHLACRDGAANTNAAQVDSARIVVVTHGQASDPFWSVVANGVEQAGTDLRVRTSYQAPTRFDMVEMSNLIDAVVASRPSGLVVSIPDAAALGGAIQRAVAAGIPVISINSGADVYARFGILAHVGQTEYEAGLAAGERMASAGVKRALCINHEVGNAGLDERCRGFGDGLARGSGSMRVLSVELANPDDAQQRVANALRTDLQVDGMLTLGTAGAEPALAALDAHTGARVQLATFDLSPRVLEALRDSKMLFAIDQQQYLQGYLPVVLLKTYIQTLALPGGGKVIATGPGFVTATNAARVIDLSARGLR